MNSNKRLNKKTIASVLKNSSDSSEEKKAVLDNMKHDFVTHLSDKQSDLNERKKCAEAAIRRHFQSILMQTPVNIQNLKIGDIIANGGSVSLVKEDGNDSDVKYQLPNISIEIPKKMIASNESPLSEVLLQNPNDAVFKAPKPSMPTVVRQLMKSVSHKKSLKEKASAQRVTRSAAKLKIESEPELGTPSESSDLVRSKSEPLNALSLIENLKHPRMAEPTEEIYTIHISAAGTPLIFDQKSAQRIHK